MRGGLQADQLAMLAGVDPHFRIVSLPGCWKVARDALRTGAVAVRNSPWKRGYLDACRKYCSDGGGDRRTENPDPSQSARTCR